MDKKEVIAIIKSILQPISLLRPDIITSYLTLSDNADVVNAFTALKELGATLQEHADLYLAVIKHINDVRDCFPYAGEFLIVLEALKELGVTPQDHKELYLAAVDNVDQYQVDEFLIALKALKESGVTPQDHKDLYLAAIDINNVHQVDEFLIALKALKELGVTPQDHKELYLAAINRRPYADEFLIALKALKELGVTPQDHKELYLAAINNVDYVDIFLIALEALKESGATPQDHKELYLAAINNVDHADKFLIALKVLKELGVTLQDHKDLYPAAINNVDHADEFLIALKVLKELGVTPQDHKDLYLAAINNVRYAGEFLVALEALEESGVTPQDHKDLYLAAINNVDCAVEFSKALKVLKDFGITPHNHKDLCLAAINTDKIDATKLATAFKIFEESGANLKDHKDLYLAVLENTSKDLDNLTQLEAIRFDIGSHAYILFTLFMKDDKPAQYSQFFRAKLLALLNDFNAKTPLLTKDMPGYEAQRATLQQLLNDKIEQEQQLTEGPLSKSVETKELERILERIANTAMNQMTMTFDNTHGYILTFGNEPPIYLNHLFNHVNFNHLELDKDLVTRIGDAIQTISSDFNKAELSTNAAVSKLPKAAQWALANYVGDKRYKNMNRVFRGLAQDMRKEYGWVTPADGTENLLANFLCGCLVNWAAKELPLKVIEDLGGDIPKVDLNLLLDRGENLTGTEELGVTERRLANPVLAPSITSVSASEAGSPHFHNETTTRTKFEGMNSARPVINPREAEQLIPHGTTLLYTNNPQGGFIAREVNSPGIVPTGFNWGAIALSHAYKQHLRHQYKDSPSQTEINGVTIARPNHGLAHTYRVMAYIPIVIDYFARHAKDEEFRLFCTYMRKNEQQWLAVAAAFSITGRESEIAAVEDLKRYDQFRQASQEHFSAFLKTYPPEQANPAMQERMEHVVRYMGNPAYEHTVDGQPGINQHPDPIEQQHRNFLNRILSTAHKLDLPRCYEPEKMESAMAACRTHSQESSEQKADYQRMITYAIDLNKAQGNALETDIAADGTLIASHQSYKAPFERASTNMRDLQAVSDTVPRPKIMEKYQLPHGSNPEVVEKIKTMCDGVVATHKKNSF